jgi:hypothetical protein
MTEAAFGELMAGMENVRAFERGKRRASLFTAPTTSRDPRQDKLTQPKFAEAFHLDVAAVRDWEQGRGSRSARRKLLLELIDGAEDGAANFGRVR